MFGVSKEPSDRNCPIIQKQSGNSSYNQTLKNKTAQHFGPLTHFRSKPDTVVRTNKGQITFFGKKILGTNKGQMFR